MASGSHPVWRDERREWKASLTHDALDAPLEQGWRPVPGVTGSQGRLSQLLSVPQVPLPFTSACQRLLMGATGGFVLAKGAHSARGTMELMLSRRTQPEVPWSFAL